MIQLPSFPFFDSAPVLEYFKTFELFRQEKDTPIIMYSTENNRYEINPDNEFQITVLANMMNIDEKYRDLAFAEQKSAFDFFRTVIDQPAFVSDDHSRIRKYLVDWYSAQRTLVTKSRHAVDPYSLTDDELNDLILSFGFPYPYEINSSQKAEFLHTLIEYYHSKGSPKVFGDILTFFNIEDFVLVEWWLKYDYVKRQLIAASQPIYPQNQQYNSDYYTEVEYRQFVYTDPYWHYDKPGSDEKAIELFTDTIEDEFGDTVLKNEISLPSILPFISLYSLTHSNEYSFHTSILNRKIYEDFEWWVKYVLNKVNPDILQPIASDCFLDGYGNLNVYNGEEWVDLGFAVPDDWVTAVDDKTHLVPPDIAEAPFYLRQNIATNVYTLGSISLLELILGFRYLAQCKFLQDITRIHDYESVTWTYNVPEGDVLSGISGTTLLYNPNTETDWIYYRNEWIDLKYNTEYYTDEDVTPDSTSLVVHFIPENENTDLLMFYNHALDYQLEYVEGGNIVKTSEDDPYRDSIDDASYTDIENLYLSLTKNANMKDDDFPSESNPISGYPHFRHCAEYDPYGDYAEDYECRCTRCQKQDVCFLRLDYYSAKEKKEDYREEYFSHFYTTDESYITTYFNIIINAKTILKSINPNFLEVIESRLRTIEVTSPDSDIEFRKYQYFYAKDLVAILVEMGLYSFKSLPNLFFGSANYKVIKNIINFFKPFRVRFREFATPVVFDNRVDDGFYVDDSICTNAVSTLQENVFLNDRIYTMSILNFNDGYGWETNIFDLNLEDVFLSRFELHYWETIDIYDYFYFNYSIMFVEDEGPFSFDSCRANDSMIDNPHPSIYDGYRSLNENSNTFTDMLDLNIYDDGEVLVNGIGVGEGEDYTEEMYITNSFQNIFTSREPELVEIFDITKRAQITNNILIATRIYTASQLNSIRYNLNHDYILMNDIDMTEYSNNWEPIGNESNPFTGSLNGQGYSITGLRIDDTNNRRYNGLFGYTLNAEIQYLNIEGAQIRVTGLYVGIIAGYMNNSTISQCFVSGTVTSSTYYVGGMVGAMLSSSITDSYSFANITGTHYIGGLVGASAAVTPDAFSYIERCYVSGIVSELHSPVGGILGYMYGYIGYTPVINSFWNTETTGQSTSVGGGTGITTSEMETQSTFTDEGWDFSTIWEMDAYTDFPSLQFDLDLEEQNWLDNPDEWTPISTIEELQLIGNDYDYPLDGKYYLTRDLDAEHTKFWNENSDPGIPFDYLGFLQLGELVVDEYQVPDFEASSPFTGIIDGNGHTINDLYIANSLNPSISSGSCLIPLNYGTIRNLNFDGLLIDNVSGASLVLINYIDATVENCHITNGELNTTYQSAPLVLLNYGNVEDCSYSGSVNSLISNELTEASGLVFNNTTVGTVIGCYSDVDIYGNGRLSGLVYTSDGADASIENCYSKCIIEGDTMEDGFIAGICANTFDNVTISKCFSVGELYGSAVIGGITANSVDTIIENCYSHCSINIGNDGEYGTSYLGGLVGYMDDGEITNCYSTGHVDDSDDNYGGMIGGVANYPTITNCFWDIITSNQNTSAGEETAATTSELLLQTTFSGWDFENIWTINEYNSYPVLTFFQKIISDYGWIEITNLGIQSLGYMYQLTDENKIESDSSDDYIDENDFNKNNNLYYLFNNGTFLEDTGYFVEHSGERFVGRFDISYDIDVTNYSTIPEDFIPIYTAEDLVSIGDSAYYPVDGYYLLMNDIDMSELGTISTICFVSDVYDPPTVLAESFQGTFNGNGHIISNITVDSNPFDIGIGGLFGFCYAAHIFDVYLEDINILGYVATGGLVGLAIGETIIERCYTLGDVYAVQQSGGLVGTIPSSGGEDVIIRNCYSGADVYTESDYAGGLINYTSATNENCFSYGFVTDYSDAYLHTGGLLGSRGAAQVSTDCFWDTETSGQATSAGAETGKTTAQMFDLETFFGWDFENIWYFDGGYINLINPRPSIGFIQADQLSNKIYTEDVYGNYDDTPDYSYGYFNLLDYGNNTITSQAIAFDETTFQNNPIIALEIRKKKDYNDITINSISVQQYVWHSETPYKVTKSKNAFRPTIGSYNYTLSDGLASFVVDFDSVTFYYDGVAYFFVTYMDNEFYWDFTDWDMIQDTVSGTQSEVIKDEGSGIVYLSYHGEKKVKIDVLNQTITANEYSQPMKDSRRKGSYFEIDDVLYFQMVSYNLNRFKTWLSIEGDVVYLLPVYQGDDYYG